MKSALIALMLAFALIIPVAASAQDWVMDWTSTGHDLFNNWSIRGTSTATLTNEPGGLPPFFSTPVHILGWTYQGQSYGGFIAEGQFQTPDFAAAIQCLLNGAFLRLRHLERRAFLDSSAHTIIRSESQYER